jgi:hypothetical protein
LQTRITTNLEEFNSLSEPRINYSAENLTNCLQVSPHSILFDHGIRDYHLQVSYHPQFRKIFFRNQCEPVPFDLFGAAFWLITRFEEYLPFKADEHNRFQYRTSIAYQYDFIQYPLVNAWLSELKWILQTMFPSLKTKERTYNYISTIDIDNAYKYKFKGFVRTLAGILSDKSLAKIKQRLAIILNRQKDPFDCYDFLIDAHRQTNTKAIYFFLLGDYGPNDKNHSASDLRFQSLIKHIADYSMVGIHPSYASNGNLKQLKIEVARLGNVVHKLITKSRQHFSMLRFPDTYQDLLQAGIMADYSMGYNNFNGFRASYCFPYKWYNLDIESVSSLTLHPFCLNENTLLWQSEKEGKSPAELAGPIINEVKKYNGQLITIFHNDTFNEKMKHFYMELLNWVK